MDFYEYDDRVQQWVGQVLDNREKCAELTLEYCRNIVGYGEENADHKLMGFGHYYMGETYYGLNDGAHFFEEMSRALSHLSQTEACELAARCYNYLGIASMSRGNAPIALDYYLNGLDYCRTYDLTELAVSFWTNIAVLFISCGRYGEAQDYLEKALGHMRTMQRSESYYHHMFCIYSNLVRSYVMQEKTDAVPQLLEYIQKELWEYGDTLDHLAIYCNETLYYQRVGLTGQRDTCIRKVDEILPQNLSILDIFDDFYDYCKVLLDAKQDESFWHLIETLEPLVKNFNINNLQLKTISLKLKYYRMHGKHAEYLQEAGLYYEMCEIMDSETQGILNNMITLRQNLEWTNRAKEKVEKENRILQKRSMTDSLTKVANRFCLNDHIDKVLEHACAEGLSLTVEILDVDYFKELNDNYGHQRGDRCLTKVAGVLKQLAKENNGFCARYGGDEFVMIYEDLTREQAVSLAEELKKRVMALKLEHKYSKALPIVTVSQGLCWGMPQEKSRKWDFLHVADEMLYRAKRSGRNNYCVGDVAGWKECDEDNNAK